MASTGLTHLSAVLSVSGLQSSDRTAEAVLVAFAEARRAVRTKVFLLIGGYRGHVNFHRTAKNVSAVSHRIYATGPDDFEK
jgi:predicted xylose isomerase-like sugar epimerase